MRYVKQIMGPLSDQQLSVLPVFYYTFCDAWGPLRAYVPSYQRNTRAGDKTFDVYMLVFGCAATSTINCQIMEGGKSTSNVVDALNRFFVESCVPKVMYIDKDSAFIKALTDGQIELLSSDGVISRERGIVFETCPAQGHNAHGRIERRIKMLQEALERCDMRHYKLHSLGWQTLAKRLEHDVNSIPLGYLNHREDTAPMLRILTPNFLKINAGANRAPSTLFTVPESSDNLTRRVEDAYKVFYKVWNNDYVPLVAKRQCWYDGDDDLVENDIVYFKLTDSVLASKWLIGKIEGCVKSKDGRVRRVLVGYKFNTEDGSRQFKIVERPVREVVRLMNVEDTTLFEEIQSVRDTCRQVLGNADMVDVQKKTVVKARSSNYIVTNACNSFLAPEFSCMAVDIGTHAILDCDDMLGGGVGAQLGGSETELGLPHDEIFNIENDNVYDTYENDYLCLL